MTITVGKGGFDKSKNSYSPQRKFRELRKRLKSINLQDARPWRIQQECCSWTFIQQILISNVVCIRCISQEFV